MIRWTPSQRYTQTLLTGESLKSQLVEHLIEFLIPASSNLLQAIEGLVKAPNPFGSYLLEALRLAHVLLLLELAIEVGRGDVN